MINAISGSNPSYFSLTETVPHEVWDRILNSLINEDNSHLLIPALSLTCKQWSQIIHHHPIVSLAKALFKIKDKADVQLSEIPTDYKDPTQQGLTPQEFTLLDRINHLYPKSFTILLNYPSSLFGENSLYLPLLHRYKWKIEQVQHSQNTHIKLIAAQQIRILTSFIYMNYLLKRKVQDNCGQNWIQNWEKNLNYLEHHFHHLYRGVDWALIKYFLKSTPPSAMIDPITKGFYIKFLSLKCYEISLKEIARTSSKDQNIMLAAVTQNGLDLVYADASLKRNRKIVLAAVKQDGWALANTGFEKDREIVLAAVKQNSLAFYFADISLKGDRQILLTAVKNDHVNLVYADASLISNREFFLAAVKQNGFALQYADATSFNKCDREIVLAAVKQDGWALQFADESLRADREIVLAAVQQRGDALKYADESLKKDREIVLAAVKNGGRSLSYADASLRKNREIVLAAVRQEGLALEAADEIFDNDREIVLAALQQNGGALYFAHASFASDREIVLNAVKQNGNALQFADASLKSDPEIVLAAIKQNGQILKFVPQSFQSDRKIVLAAVNQYGQALQYAHASLRSDREIVLAAVTQNSEAIQYADITFQTESFGIDCAKQLFFNLKLSDTQSSAPHSTALSGKRKREAPEIQGTERPNKRLATAKEEEKN